MIAKSPGNNPCQPILSGMLVMMLALFAIVEPSLCQEADVDPDRTGRLLKVELPLTGPAANSIIQQIREIASQMPAAVAAEDRSVLVLEFDAENMNAGMGSDLGGCISLAEFLAGPELKSVRTVAWIPANETDTAPVSYTHLTLPTKA